MIVADATVLIALAKIGRLELLRQTYGSVVIGPAVKIEVVDQGKAISAVGVEQVELAITQRWLRVVRPTRAETEFTRKLLSSTYLHEGEAEALALARSRKLTLIVDDKEARTMARTVGVEYLGTAGMLLEAFARKRLSITELEIAVRDLSGVLWLSPNVVADILRLAREMSK